MLGVVYSTITLWTGPFQIKRVIGHISLLPCFVAMPIFSANNEDPDQTPRSVAFDMGLYCLSKSI